MQTSPASDLDKIALVPAPALVVGDRPPLSVKYTQPTKALVQMSKANRPVGCTSQSGVLSFQSGESRLKRPMRIGPPPPIRIEVMSGVRGAF